MDPRKRGSNTVARSGDLATLWPRTYPCLIGRHRLRRAVLLTTFTFVGGLRERRSDYPFLVYQEWRIGAHGSGTTHAPLLTAESGVYYYIYICWAGLAREEQPAMPAADARREQA